jgi:hypothetical protein
MRKVLASVVTLVLAMPTSLLEPLRAQSDSCAACQPTRLNNGWDVAAGELTVCFKSNANSTWGSTKVATAQGGFTYWQSILADQGRSITFTFETKSATESCSSEAIRVEAVDSSNWNVPDASAQATGNSTGRGGLIEINQNNFNSTTIQWDWEMAHEFGHFLDFADAMPSQFPSQCADHTVMYWVGGLPLPSLTNACGDKLAATTKYHGSNTSQDFSYDPLEDDCYNVYRVSYWYFWDGQTLTYLGWTSIYWGQYCGPPPY